MKQQLEIQQKQGLVMTKELHHSISLLQLSNAQLHAQIDAFIEGNVFLEKEELEDNREESPYYHTHLSYNSDRYERDYSNEEALHKMSLHSYLRKEINIYITNTYDKEVIYSIIDKISDNGYFLESPEHIALELKIDVKKLLYWVQKIQACEPMGIGAFGIEECLRMQLREKNGWDEDKVMQILLKNLDLIAQKKYKKLQTLCDTSSVILEEKIGIIKKLNPSPGNIFLPEENNPVFLQPDLFMTVDKNNNWKILPNHSAFPRISLQENTFEKTYHASLSGKEKNFLQQQWQEALWMRQSLKQRSDSILRVAHEIVTRQKAFFKEGITSLKPMKRTDISSVLGIHESTVSRVTTGKYIQTPQGCFELRYFFSPGLKNTDISVDIVSNKSVQNAITHLIKHEEKENILSDQKVAEYITRNIVPISRRTVTKYRKLLGIPSSTMRKREKYF